MILKIILPVALAFIMFTLGLGLTISNFRNILRYPKVFIIGLTNQMVLLPLVAFLIASIFDLPGDLAIGMMILACCPGGATSNLMTRFAKGDVALSISYTAVVSVVASITLPFIVSLSYQHFMGIDKSIDILILSLIMFALTSVPVLLGLYINTKYTHMANAFRLVADKISIILFVIIVISALVKHWSAFIENLDILGLSIITLISIMLFIGYSSARLLKTNKSQAITISIESGIQNATVGITVGNLIDGTKEGLSDFALTSGVYGILMYFICLPVILIFFRKK